MKRLSVIVLLAAILIPPGPMIDGEMRPTKCLGVGDCLEWPEEPVCPEEPPPGAGATPGGPYATDLTETEEQWRPLIARYFCHPYAVEEAMRILACESNGDPDVVNPASGTTGLFQHAPQYWAERSAQAGWAGASMTDPEANTAVAAWLWRQAGGWSDWHCRPIP